MRELYLPQSALWLADYPFVDRGSFLDISLGIERMRQEEMERQNRASVDYDDDADIAQAWTGVASYEESQEDGDEEGAGGYQPSSSQSEGKSSAWKDD